MTRVPRDLLRHVLLPWAAMLVLLAAELAAMAVGLSALAPLLGLLMTAIVIARPMRIATAPPLAWIFALAALFWLLIPLFSLGVLDPLTRHHPPGGLPSSPGSVAS